MLNNMTLAPPALRVMAIGELELFCNNSLTGRAIIAAAPLLLMLPPPLVNVVAVAGLMEMGTALAGLICSLNGKLIIELVGDRDKEPVGDSRSDAVDLLNGGVRGNQFRSILQFLYTKMFINLRYIFFIAICILTQAQAQDNQASSGDCNEDLKEFENDTIYGKHVVWVSCKGQGKEVLNVGVILSKNAILTDNSMKMDGIKCSVLYYTSHFDGTAKQDMLPGLIVASYGNVNDIRPHSTLPHLKIILTAKELSMDLENAQPIPLLEKELDEKSVCVISVPESYKLYDRKTEVVPRSDCELAYPDMHQGIVCVRTPIKYCKIDHCSKYNVEGSPLICDGAVAGIVMKDLDKCDPSKPCLTAKPNDIQQWIESNMNLLNRDDEFKNSTVSVTFLAENDSSVHAPGVIIDEGIVLTSAVTTNTSEGFVFYHGGEKIAWNSAMNYANNWPAVSDKLQLGVIAFNQHLDPKKDKKMKISTIKPSKDDKCILAIADPDWVKLEVSILDDDKCRAALPNYHEDYMCARPKFDGVQFGIDVLPGTPIICNGELAGISARIEDDKNTLYPFVPMHKMNVWIGASEMALRSGSPPKKCNSFYIIGLFLAPPELSTPLFCFVTYLTETTLPLKVLFLLIQILPVVRTLRCSESESIKIKNQKPPDAKRQTYQPENSVQIQNPRN
uniref:Peptidase S1 domain-containing protein n=1 Tax=Glossina brevipalpis TaxID=37001 RepID=A0A1A9WH06_9MUSC